MGLTLTQKIKEGLKGNVAGQGGVRGLPEEVISEDEKVSRPCKALRSTCQEEPAWARAWYVPEGQEGPVWLQQVRGKGRKRGQRGGRSQLTQGPAARLLTADIY